MESDVFLRTARWLSSQSNQALVLLVPYLAAVVAIVSYLFTDGGQGTPSRLEIGLISVSMLAALLLSMHLVGTGGTATRRRR